MKLNSIVYENLNARQKENYNFQKVAAVLADYGFNCLRLTDDWEGADFIACHIDGNTFLKVQLKGRLAFNKKYERKNIHIAFRDGDSYYLYPHDEVLKKFLDRGWMKKSKAWNDEGSFSFPHLSEKHKDMLKPYKYLSMGNR